MSTARPPHPLFAAIAALLLLLTAGCSRVVSVTVDGGDRTLAVGDTAQLTATVETRGGASQQVAWESSRPEVATVNYTGFATALVAGDTEIRAVSVVDRAKSGAITLTVSALTEDPAPSISIETATNGMDADAPPGPRLRVGAAVTWTYVITNTGNVALTDVLVEDDQIGVIACPKDRLEPDESMTCSASGSAVAGQYANVGTVTGAPSEGDEVSATDPSHYLGEEADDPTPPAAREGFLDGPSEAPALDHTGDLYVRRELDPGEVSEDPAIEDREVLRTEIEVLFVDDVTVGQVNALLADVDGAIVGMTQGVPSYVIRIPDPGDLAALRDLIEALQARDEVVLVLEAVLVRTERPLDAAPRLVPQVLPPGLGLDRVDRVDHHLAVRAHAAWNARQALPSLSVRPWFLIADSFGNGPPGADVDAAVVSSDFADVPRGDTHGYHVLGIANAYFGESGDSATRNRITGMFPASLRLRAADTFDNAVGSTWADLPVLMIDRVRAILDEDPNARIVINTSLNSRSLTDDERMQRAFLWARRVRAADLERRVVHVTSAGNVRGGATWPAEENSVFTKAALSNTRIRFGFVTFTEPRLTNTLVVENRVNTASGTQRPEPGCLSRGSQVGGTISAMGTSVWSFTGPEAGPGMTSGTSMATPQVAGLAAYVWSLAPHRNAQAVIQVLLDTARAMDVAATPGFNCNEDTGAPVIDAFDAILAAGGAAARRAILDVTGSGTFTERDLARVLEEFDARDGALDYSRYDLNGSGHTGGPSTERFDLDMSGSNGLVLQSAEGVTLLYNENGVTDMGVLCYYGFSNLYAGDEAARFELLASRCGILPLKFYPPRSEVIGTIGPGTITIGQTDHPTLPAVTFWSSQSLAQLRNSYLYPMAESEGWWHEFFEYPVEREYLLSVERPTAFYVTVEEWSLLRPSIMARAVEPDDGLPDGARTFVRVVYDETLRD